MNKKRKKGLGHDTNSGTYTQEKKSSNTGPIIDMEWQLNLVTNSNDKRSSVDTEFNLTQF